MKAVENVLEFAATAITDSSKLLKRTISGRSKLKEFSFPPPAEDGKYEGGTFHGISTQKELLLKKASAEGSLNNGVSQDGSFSDSEAGNPERDIQYDAFEKKVGSKIGDKISQPQNDLSVKLDSSSKVLRGKEREMGAPSISGGKGAFQRRSSVRSSVKRKTIRPEGIPLVRNRNSFKKKKTKFKVFNSAMSSHERRESLQRNLNILPEISNITHVSSELPLAQPEIFREMDAKNVTTMDDSTKDNIYDVDIIIPIGKHTGLDPLSSESLAVESDALDVVKEDEDDKRSHEKLKKQTGSKEKRDRTSKPLSSKDYDTKKKKTTKKSSKKSAMKSSMSLIDLVVASTEKVGRWSYALPESDEEAQIIRRRKVNSGIVKSSSTGSINQLLEPSMSSNEHSIAPMEEADSDRRRATASSFGESDTITTTDNEEEEKGDGWKNAEASQGEEHKHALKTLSRSTPAMSPSGSPRHSDSEVPARLSRINKVFRKKFSSVSTNEKVINYYACAIVSDILLQGTLYITENFFAFYSNIFGYVNRTILPIVDVASIQKEKTAKFIPNAVGVQMFDGKTYVFSSLISRDATYKFMIHTWRKSRKLTDSDSEPPFIIPGPKEDDEESELNSVDSNCDDDSVDNNIVEGSSVSSHNDAVWSQSSPVILSNSLGSSADNSGHATPITLVKESLPSVTSLDSMDNDKSSSKKSLRSKDSEASLSSSSNQWIVHTNIINSVLHVGVAPFQAVREGLHEITYLPKTSVLLIISSALVFLLLASAAFMIYKVEILSQHINFSPPDEYTSNLYEEVLRMQQKLHSATAEEVEKTLSLQIKQLTTVRQSLDALTYLFNKEPSQPSPQIQENT